MNLTSSPCDDPTALAVAAIAREAGVDRIGFARADAIEPEQQAHYESWLNSGAAAAMDYLTRYPDVRFDPRQLLPGAATVISCAISYWHAERQAPSATAIAMYAHGDDYHDVVRRMLRPVAEEITRRWGADCRICIDTAPVRERYWALKSGVGFRGKNGLLIVPGVGSYCFLAEIVTTLPIAPTAPLRQQMCCGCDACLNACPGKALGGDGTVDCRRCLSYLTIEYRGDFPDGFSTGGRLAGCDACQSVCPHNSRPLPTRQAAFHLRPQLRELSRDEVGALTPETYAALLHGSSLKRIKLPALLRNLRHL